MYSIENNTGRLIEACLASPLAGVEVEGCIARIRALVLSLSQKVVFVVDLTGCTVLAPDIADKFLAMMRADNPRVERTAYLLPPQHALIGLQVERLIRDAGSPVRRTFRDFALAEAWLSSILNPREQDGLHRFLSRLRGR